MDIQFEFGDVLQSDDHTRHVPTFAGAHESPLAGAGEMEFEAALRPVVNVISYEGVAGHTTFQLAVSSAPFRDLPLLRLLG